MFWGHLFAWLSLMKEPGLPTPYPAMPVWQRILSHMSLICPPVMFFFVADGYKYSRDRKKYALRLLIFACITQIPDWIVFLPRNGWWTSNVIFTLLLGLLEIMAWESGYTKKKRILLVILLEAASLLIMSDWLIFGGLFILFLHIYRDEPKKRFVSYTVTAAVWKGTEIIFEIVNGSLTAASLLDNMLDFTAVMLAYLLMTTFYSGKKGKHPVFSKWFFYIFYPLHYMIIYAVYLITK